MKSILLATAASVAFAGAAAAEVTFSGSAEASYNNDAGVSTYATAAELKATMSAALDNGYTATASVTFDPDADNVVSKGSISVSSDTASITFGTGLNGAAFDTVGDEYAAQLDDDGEEGVDGITASYKLDAATIRVSMPMAADAAPAMGDIEVGVSADVSGFKVAAAIANNSNFAMTASGAVAGATVSLGLATGNVWDASVSYPVGPVTLSASTDEANAWEVGGSYAVDALTVGVTYNSAKEYEVTGSYTAGDAMAKFSYDGTDFNLAGTYTMGAIGLEAGVKATDMYAQASYNLGGGATLSASYSQAADINIAEDLAKGTTVKVAFAF